MTAASGPPPGPPVRAAQRPDADAAPVAGPGPTYHEPAEASVGDLVSQVSQHLSTLLRQEMALARAEAGQTVKDVAKGAGLLSGAASAAHFVLLFASLALWWALGTAMGDGPDQPALGASALIVAAIWAVVAAVLAAAGRARLTREKGLPRTAETVSKIPHALKGQEPS